MCVCVYVCIYVCMYVYVYVCMYVLCVCMFCVCMCVCVYACVCMCVFVCMYVCVCVCCPKRVQKTPRFPLWQCFAPTCTPWVWVHLVASPLCMYVCVCMCVSICFPLLTCRAISVSRTQRAWQRHDNKGKQIGGREVGCTGSNGNRCIRLG